MRKILLLLILSFYIKGYSQELKFETLKLNTSPAYNVLGVDPQNIQRPGSPGDFVAGAQSAVVNGRLQPNFAMETTPYYWKHIKNDQDKRVSIYDFLKPQQNIFKNISQTFTLSLATSASDTSTFNLPGTGLGIGIKFNLFNGRISKKTVVQISRLVEVKLFNNLYHDINSKLRIDDSVDVNSTIEAWLITKKKGDIELDALMDYIAAYVKKDLRKKQLTLNDTGFVKALINKNAQQEAAHLSTLNEAVFPLTREGFMLEVAFADAVVLQNNAWDSIGNAKAAIWLTPSWRFNTRKDPSVIDYLDVMAVARYTWNAKKVDSSSYFDAGAKLQYTHNRFSISGEYIARMLTKKPSTLDSKWTNRLDISMAYKVNDFITFNATFGRNFDGNSVHYSDPAKMFAVGGFNFGFGNLFKQEK